MQSFLWAIGSLVILVPIIYFLPLGISLRGKWLVIIISFILGLTGLLAKAIFPLWKTILMLLLLMGLVVYFIEKKLGSVMFLPEGPASGKAKEIEPQKEVIEDWVISEKLEEKDSIKDEVEVLTEDNLEMSNDDSFIEPISEPVLQVTETYSENVSEELDDGKEDISFIQVREKLLEAEDNFIEEMDISSKEDSDATEFEGLMNLKLETLSNNGMSEHNESDTDDETISEYFNSLVEENNIDKEDLDATDLDKVFIHLNEESLEMVVAAPETENDIQEIEEQLAEKIFDLDSSAEPNFNKIVIDEQVNQDWSGSEIVKEDDDEEQMLKELLGGMPTTMVSYIDVKEIEEELVKDALNEEEAFVVGFDSGNEVEAMEESSEVGISEPEVQEDTNKSIGQDLAHKELLHTMVSQLELISKKLEPQEFEKLIQEHMHEQLPVHDYYTFASLLITHYIRMKKFDELEKLISSISSKVKGYAILEQELEFIYNRYCVKIQ